MNSDKRRILRYVHILKVILDIGPTEVLGIEVRTEGRSLSLG